MINVIKKLHGDESAQISFLAVGGVICFVGLMSMVINTNDIITERVHMQDVADATVLSAASWTARGLNTISFVNVLNTKLISTAVLLNALADALPVIQAVGKIQLAIFRGCSGVPFIGAFCAAMAVVVDIQLRALDFLKRNIVDPMAKNLSQCSGNKRLWTMMKGLEKLATVVQKSFAAVGILESMSIAKANGATLGLVVNGEFTSVAAQLTLPVKQTKFTDHCPYIKDGGPGFELQSYSCNEGPLEVGKSRIQWTLLVPWTTFVAQPIFSGMVSKNNTQIGCTNDPGEDSKIPVTLNSLDQCSEYDGKARWSHVWGETVQLTAAQATFTLNDFIPWRPRNEYGGSKDESDAEAKERELQEQLEELGIPGDDAAGAPEPPKPQGRAVVFIDPAREIMVEPDEGVLVNCRNPRYPSYTPPSPFADYDWNANRPGQTSPWSGPPFCTYCLRIDEWGKFTWVSGQHVIGGPKTSGGYFIRIEKRDIPPKEEGGETKYVYVVETVSLVSAGEVHMDQEEFDEYLEKEGQEGVNTEGNKSSSGCTKEDQPIPWMLDKGTTAKQQEDFQNRLRFIGIVWKDMNENPPFWNGFFDETPPTMYAYAQGQVYNYLSEDTFTQDWRVRLEQASLLESFLKSDAAGNSGVKKFLGGAISAVNNH